jgi:hypothetical protein
MVVEAIINGGAIHTRALAGTKKRRHNRHPAPDASPDTNEQFRAHSPTNVPAAVESRFPPKRFVWKGLGLPEKVSRSELTNRTGPTPRLFNATQRRVIGRCWRSCLEMAPINAITTMSTAATYGRR